MIRIGTSGWVYRDWRERFYPKAVPQRRWLSYYAERFDTVELNATTYRLPKAEQVRAWCAAVPPDFRYTVKLSRLITHRRDLPERLDDFVANYFERASCFVPSLLAQILIQFPPYLERDDDRLERFLRKLPPGYVYVVEFRHRSWFEPPVRALLERLGAGFCIHDYPGLRVPEWITTRSLAYLRLHGAAGLYVGSYSKRRLQRWAGRLRVYEREARDVYVYFNNDTAAAAPHDARLLRDLLG
ncbi:MAG: DUF72 domain-containing protein [Candidatus Eremiobacteraeota bacterium]|nr:DUF72 domain-containing protein [Candidatus Eremiobacteraeota bacterium]MBV8723244.1 DUF72 domain-containing protein [Candidatus Eremiobacteraeota bacterium]